jgi:hypothetical protein
MKQLLILSLLLFFSDKMVCQNAFYDAKFILDKTSKIRENQKKIEKLKPLPAKMDSTDAARLADFDQIVKFVANPFDTTLQLDANQIRQTLDDIPKVVARITLAKDTTSTLKEMPAVAYDASAMGHASGPRLTSIPSTSFLSASQIIDGTAMFLKRRVKEELSVAFLDRFRKRLNENEFLGHLLPSTHRLLQSVVDMDNSLPSLNNIAVNAFQSDLESLPEHIESTLLYDASFAEIRKDRTFKYFALPFNAIKNIQKGNHPAMVLQDLRDKYFTDTTELDRIVQMMVALNDNLRDTTIDGYDPEENLWITGKQWDELKQKGSNGNELFMGLMFQKNKNTIFNALKNSPPAAIRQSMLLLSENVDEYLVQLKSFESMRRGIQGATNRGTKDSLALELGWSLLQLVDNSHELYFSLFENKQQLAFKKLYWDTLKPIAEATLKAVSCAQRKNYGGLMLNSYEILRNLSQIEKWQNGKVFGNEYLRSFFYYGNFMSDVLMANNSEDVANILDRYAAPVGSYSIKRRSRFSMSLNAFPGLFMGWEKPKKSELLRGVSETSFVTGVTAPIGLAFNFGGLTTKTESLKKPGERNYQSLSAFVSVIDIGAVLSYRWANDQAQGLPQSVEWAQVLAPGLHVVYGFPNLPLALNMGFQVAPKLRKVTAGTTNELKNTDFLRFNIGLTTDITIFNFYSTGKIREHK